MEEMNGFSGPRVGADSTVHNLLNPPANSFADRRKKWLQKNQKQTGWAKRG